MVRRAPSGLARHKQLFRILDANFNRAREGLRVAEEIVRFAMDSKSLQSGFKRCRHGVHEVLKRYAVGAPALIRSRRTTRDVGRGPSRLENARADLAGVFLANVQRAKESLRALEEFSKLIDAAASKRFKEIRFDVYALEKKSLSKLEALRHHVSRASGRPKPRDGGRAGAARRRARRPVAR